MLDADVMTVLDVNAFTGLWNAVIPGAAVLVVLDIALGSIAVYLLTQASSSSAQ